MVALASCYLNTLSEHLVLCSLVLSMPACRSAAAGMLWWCKRGVGGCCTALPVSMLTMPFPSLPQALPGFTEEPAEPKFVLTGFARNAVLGVAGEVVDAVKQGHLKHIFLIGG